MRVSVPTVPHAILSAKSPSAIPPSEAIERVARFLAPGNVTVLTGAGVSVDSGIRAYRGRDGRYLNPNYKPIFYHELIDETEKGHAFRKRYWSASNLPDHPLSIFSQHVHVRLRSYLGYPPVSSTLPNTTHFALAALQYTSVVPKLITQNVDGLHRKAVSHIWGPARIQEGILELHGTLHRVRCKYGHIIDRNSFQDMLSAANPRWKDFVNDLEKTGSQPRSNPDGDVAIENLGVSYNDFVVPDCVSCLLENRRNPIHKPEVTFFGESISRYVKERSFHDVEQADRLFLVGTTLATYSAFRLLKRALELRKEVMLLNVGPSRADGLPGVEKIDMYSGAIIRDVVRAVVGIQAFEDPVVVEMLQSGIVKPPPDDNDRSPRAAG